MRNQISVGPAAAIYLCERYDLMLHPLLRVGMLSVQLDEEERVRIPEEGRAELRQQGLLQTDEVHPFLDDAWHLLAYPPLAVGMAVRDDEESFNAVLVEQGRGTLRAYQADADEAGAAENILLDRQEYGGLGGNAVKLLGELEPLSGGSASVPTELLKQAGQRMGADPSGSAVSALAASGIRQNDARVLANVMTTPRTTEALITARSHDRRVNRTHKLPVTLQVFRTAQGCYMTQRSAGSDGREWFTVAPADQRKVTAKVEEMLEHLRRD
ncbi:secretion protein [Actinopolyspora erythraea]|uniref:Secretion protein n=1 Tax=Actinopolyspora erythraea TaxID=414996 RepID=A0ABR4X8I2_9ACTN|nr:secretion protein [Actinopolyspora erythraea]